MAIRLKHSRWSLLFLLGSAACMSWRTQPLTPLQVLSERHPDRIRITLADSSTFILEQPAISGDSITGLTGRTRIAIAPAQVARVETLKKDSQKTWALISIIVAAAWASGGGPGGGAPRIGF